MLFTIASNALSFYKLLAHHRAVDTEAGDSWEEISQAILFDLGVENSVASLSLLRRRCQDGKDGKQSLREVVRDLYSLHRPQMLATDPRDRIYALLNLSADAGHLGITPDYSDSLTTDQLYTQAGPSLRVGSTLDLVLTPFLTIFTIKSTLRPHLSCAEASFRC